MPIFSYLAIPTSGAKETLCCSLATLPHCEVIPSDNREVVVLVTDTPDEATEDKLQKSLKNLQSLQSLSLTFGYDDKEKQGR
jgi:nitrate reductase NapAB chaperone NapD